MAIPVGISHESVFYEDVVVWVIARPTPSFPIQQVSTLTRCLSNLSSSHQIMPFLRPLPPHHMLPASYHTYWLTILHLMYFYSQPKGQFFKYKRCDNIGHCGSITLDTVDHYLPSFILGVIIIRRGGCGKVGLPVLWTCREGDYHQNQGLIAQSFSPSLTSRHNEGLFMDMPLTYLLKYTGHYTRPLLVISTKKPATFTCIKSPNQSADTHSWLTPLGNVANAWEEKLLIIRRSASCPGLDSEMSYIPLYHRI